MKINAKGLAILKRFEGCRLRAYKCPAGVWTIGYGHTGDVRPGHAITQHQADVILESDLEIFEHEVDRIPVGLNENQFSALVCFAFNVGRRAFRISTLHRKLLERDMVCAAGEFGKWIRGGGKVLPGLIRRRSAECALFLEPPPKESS